MPSQVQTSPAAVKTLRGRDVCTKPLDKRWAQKPVTNWGIYYLNSKAMNCCYSSRPPKIATGYVTERMTDSLTGSLTTHCGGGQNGDGRFDGGCDGKYDSPACV